MATKPVRMAVAAYARARGVSRQAIYLALSQGLAFRHPDGGIDVAATDGCWGRRHALDEATWGGLVRRGHASEPIELPPDVAARIDAELKDLWASLTGSPPSFG